MVTAIYPGSFDPLTLGHVDILTRASKLFGKVIMAVVVNQSKQSLLPLVHRVKLIQESLAHVPNVHVASFDGLLVDFAKQHQASIIIRGLRAISDFEYEFQMSQMNKTLNPSLETVFMMAKLDYTFVSSSMVKEVFTLGGDISTLVPDPVNKALEHLKPIKAG